MLNFIRSSGYELIDQPTSQQLETNPQDNSICRIYSYHNRSLRRLLLFHFIALLTFGVLYLLVAWFPRLIVLKLTKCTLNIADIILLKDIHGNYEVITVRNDVILIPNRGFLNIRYFLYQHTKFILDETDGFFKTLDDLLPKLTLNDIIDGSTGVSENQQKDLYDLYGPNSMEVEIKSYWTLFVEEVFNPFYLFQVFSFLLWCIDDYVIYAVCVLILTLLSIVTTLYQTRKQSEALHNLVISSSTNTAAVCRPNFISEDRVCSIDAAELVPNDILIIPRSGCIMPCDAVLLTGNCIVNESMLTGESTPITKTPPHNSFELFDSNIHKRHVLFCGTRVLQARYYEGKYVMARVVKTGFETMKGQLIKSILFPTPVGVKFYKDSMKFLLSLSIIAMAGMGYCIYLYYMRGAELRYIILRTLDIITIVVPPALPAAMTVGMVYSQSRLKKRGIFCTSPPRINLAGKVKLACFDKTGTLTEDGLELKLIVPCEDKRFFQSIESASEIDYSKNLVKAMATCHSLTRIDERLIGDPLDLNMFENTKWELEEPGEKENTRYDMLAPVIVKPSQKELTPYCAGDDEIPYCIGIIRQFPFSSTQQCMSVICRELGDPCMLVFSKGAPERIRSFCREESLPNDFSKCLSNYTSQGFRVIALACKRLSSSFKWKDAQKIGRDIIECDMTFLGFMIMQNSLKRQTSAVIRTLHNANIRTVMITGDNIMTAACVARDCGMVQRNESIVLINLESDIENQVPKLTFELFGSNEEIANISSKRHFAMDGKTWNKLREYYSDYLPHILVRGTIFARFQPSQKTQLINHLQKLDYTVSMVGDGANDCGALKTAHVGVSLSQAEASVAAPFTSHSDNISCIEHLILEGRCSLVTSFATFKYMALYSLIQFFSVLILYAHHSILGDAQFLFIDLIVTTSLAVTIGLQGPARRLISVSPMGSLVSARNLIPIIIQVAVCAAIQIGAYYYLSYQSWFQPLPPGKQEVIMCWENTVIFIVSCYQYIIIATIYSKGRPFRKMLITNFWFLVSALSLTCFITFLFIHPPEKLASIFEIIEDDHSKTQSVFKDTILLFPVMHFIVAMLIESGIADCQWFKRFLQCACRKRKHKSEYKRLLKQDATRNWLMSPEFRTLQID